MIPIKTFAFNLLQENTYVVSDETLECVIIDCGAYYDDERKALTEYISSEGLKPRHLLATHGHWDHNLGIDTVYENYGLQVEAAHEDEFIITRVHHNRHTPQLSEHRRRTAPQAVSRRGTLFRHRRGHPFR